MATDQGGTLELLSQEKAEPAAAAQVAGRMTMQHDATDMRLDRQIKAMLGDQIVQNIGLQIQVADLQREAAQREEDLASIAKERDALQARVAELEAGGA